jgi:uncharacterized protein (DUF608 family)
VTTPSNCSDHQRVRTQSFARRDFLKLAGLVTAGAALPNLPAIAGPFTAGDFQKVIPANKKLSAAWLRSLTERGEPTVYRGSELETIGMPVGGICAGQLYLGGDGRLWHWDIFNAPDPGQLVDLVGGPHYARPLKPKSPLEQGFALKVGAAGGTQVRRLDQTGFPGVSFCGEYPIGTVHYDDAACPVAVKLEAYSPFIPLDADDSGLPATVMEFTVKNTSSGPVEVELAGWLENAVCKFSKGAVGVRRNRVARDGGMLRVEAGADSSAQGGGLDNAGREDIVFADFEGGTYGAWKTEGTAFGSRPVTLAEIPAYQSPLTMGAHGQALVNSHASAPGADVGAKDAATGRLISPEFTIERNHIRFLIGGGLLSEASGLRLIVDGKVVRTACSNNDNKLRTETFEVREFAGQKAHMEIVDQAAEGWGSIGVDHIVFTDVGGTPVAAADAPDFGTLALALLAEESGDRACADVGDAQPASVFQALGSSSESAEKPIPGRLIGAAGRRWTLKPGDERKAVFVIAWHFPSLKSTVAKLTGGLGNLRGFEKLKPYYAKMFRSAADVAVYLGKDFTRLSGGTKLWRDTWYDSTLPYWLLDRTLLNISTLATATCYRFDNGRFYSWEGVYCCAGTCTSVWFYAQAVARLFPSLERSAREMQDFAEGVGFDPATGGIWTRGEWRGDFVLDGQAGDILRAYREHQMSPDDAFLKRNWPNIRKALQWLIGEDGNGDGIIDGKQSTTLDTGLWWGAMSWTSSLYLAALRAGEEMAREMGDAEFAKSTRAIADAGAKNLVERLWNGEYFVHKPDRSQPKSFIIGNGCHIDQVYGQAWADQVGLGRILPAEQTRSALRSIWKYNFTPDVGPFRRQFKDGRWYAMAGEGGTIMTTWPHGDRELPKVVDANMAGGMGYLNECMSGFEHQVAGHMIGEGLLMEGLAIERAIHDRHHASRRNPWNEIECGDHYSRAMASYGVFIAVCGFEYHGPKGHIGFAPRVTPENFRAAFTAAEGWGTYQQKREPARFSASLEVAYGRLQLAEWSVVPGFTPREVHATVDGKAVSAALRLVEGRVFVEFSHEVVVQQGAKLDIELT